MKNRILSHKVLSTTLSALLLVAFMIAALPSPGAAAAAPDEPPPNDGAVATRVLERRYQRVLDRSDRQQQILVRVQELIVKADEKLADMKANGKDAASLEAALDELRAAVTSSTAFLNQAESVLATHPGFDADGKVTDIDQARDTLYTVDDLLFESKEVLEHAARAVRRAIHEYRQDITV
ncbi:MAG: hypothetical protein HPY76_11080 [Anaerolineae bacterium]|jgi:hypothetical protein|nr:hypothetical protein [Anaerolineae bacterium]